MIAKSPRPTIDTDPALNAARRLHFQSHSHIITKHYIPIGINYRVKQTDKLTWSVKRKRLYKAPLKI